MNATANSGLNETIHNAGSTVYDLAISLAAWLGAEIGVFEGSPETVLGILILFALLLLLLK